MTDEEQSRQLPLLAGNYKRTMRRGRPMREVLTLGHCKGCGAVKDGKCKFTGLVVRDADPCRAPVPPKRRKKRR